MKKTLTAIAAVAALTACTSGRTNMLVLYYSQEGATRKVAEEIAARTGADIEAFDVETPYSGTFDETVERCLKERSEGVTPALNPLSSDISGYDVIFLGYPIWFGTYAPPVAALLGELNLDGKTIVPFCTFGSGGLQSSVSDLRKALPNADIREGYGIRVARISKVGEEVERFLVLGGFKEGKAEAYPDYSAQAPVTEEQAAIFEAACSGYPMPLGKPVTAGMRETPAGTDYLFEAEGNGPDGSVSRSKIYVTVPREEGGVPEFTMVVR